MKKKNEKRNGNIKKKNHFTLTQKNIHSFSHKFNTKRTNKVFKNVNTNTKFKYLVTKADYNQNKKIRFKNIIEITTKPTNQESSGRCWIFAFLNIMRIPMIKKYNLPADFEFSQNYLFFYDKLEKANYFFNYIYDTKNIKVDDFKNYKIANLKVVAVLNNLISDGGNWNMFYQLIKKYGIIPKSNMDDHLHSKNSKELRIFLNEFLSKSAKTIRTTTKSKNKVIAELMDECYKILVIFLGEPPKKIIWEYYESEKNNSTKANTKNKTKKVKDKTGKANTMNKTKNMSTKDDKTSNDKTANNETNDKQKYKAVYDITPQEFYEKFVPYNVDDKVALINYPCKTIPFYKNYILENNSQILDHNEKRTRNYYDKEKFLNFPIDTIRNMVKKSIDDDEAVWCGVDIRKFISTEKGFLDIKGFNYNDVFGFDNLMPKCSALNYKQSSARHAVIIKGYNYGKGKTHGFLVENSWGEKDGFKGNYYMADNWFENFVYRVIVDKKYLSTKELNTLKHKPVLLPFWAPFNDLA